MGRSLSHLCELFDRFDSDGVGLVFSDALYTEGGSDTLAGGVTWKLDNRQRQLNVRGLRPLEVIGPRHRTAISGAPRAPIKFESTDLGTLFDLNILL